MRVSWLMALSLMLRAFFPGVSMNMGGCVSYTGNTRPDEVFAQIMHSCFSPIQVVDACDLY